MGNIEIMFRSSGRFADKLIIARRYKNNNNNGERRDE